MNRLYNRICDGCGRHYEGLGKKYCSLSCYRRHYAKHFKRNDRCGQCPRKIEWRLVDGHPHPFNKDDGRDHFLDCPAVSERVKRVRLATARAVVKPDTTEAAA